MRRAIWASNSVAFTINDPRIEPVPFSGCWIWKGAVQDRHAVDMRARGTVLRYTTQMPAYRAFYEKQCGAIDGYSLHHTCHTPLCCNPDHLEPMTRKEHALHHFGETGAGRTAATHRAKTCCPRCGNAYTKELASRRCKTCTNARRKEQTQNISNERRAARNAYKLAWKRRKSMELAV